MSTRRQFIIRSATAALSAVAGQSSLGAQEMLDPRTAGLVAKTIGIDTHNHIDVPLTDAEMPSPDIDLRGDMKRSGLSAICMTFATDYQRGDPYQRFLKGLASMDAQLRKNAMKRALTAADIRSAHAQSEPTVVQAVEGAHFLEGKLERVAEAHGRGLRHFGLLHDSDASVPLGDVYTNRPQFGGLTAFGASVIRECNRLGMLVDLAHADVQTTAMALKTSTRPVIISHTGLDTQLGGDPRMAQMMRPRLIGKEQAKAVANAGGAIGVWTHLSDTPLEYAKNIRSLVDVIGVDHVCLGTDTKLTKPSPRPNGPPPSGGPGSGPPGGGNGDGGPDGPGSGRRVFGGSPPGDGPRGPQRARVGERTNEAWADETAGYYFVVVDALLKVGFNPDEIAKIGGGNYLRLFAAATGK